ncbi:hypothetical protein BKA93DRAFT_822518 [Sparassis latifolia]
MALAAAAAAASLRADAHFDRGLQSSVLDLERSSPFHLHILLLGLSASLSGQSVLKTLSVASPGQKRAFSSAPSLSAGSPYGPSRERYRCCCSPLARRPFPERARRKRQRIPRRTSARCRMVKKRRSVQSLFATVVQLASAPDSPARPASPSPRTHARTRTRSRASSAATLSPASPSSSSSRFGSVSSLPDLPLLELGTTRRHSPPPDLLDSDPFANLSPAPSERSPRLPPLDFSDAAPVSPLRSPLASPVLPRPAELVRPKSSGQAQSAHTRPAFRPRPSLPSLNTRDEKYFFFPKCYKCVSSKIP